MARASIIACALLALACAAAGAAAQETGDGFFGFQAGLVLGSMGGDMNGDDLAAELAADLGGSWTAEKKRRTGLLGGLTYMRMFGPRVGVQLEANYTSRGVRFDLASDTGMVETRLKFNYVEFPVLFRFMPSPGERTQPVFLAGPVVGFSAGPKVSASREEVTATGDLDGVESISLGLTGAAALRMVAGEKSAILLQVRYHVGLSNAVENPMFETTASDVMLMAGMEFELPRY